MNIILDSTELKDNYYLDTPRFQALFAYLKKTKSKLFIPDIVISETIKNFSKEIDDCKDIEKSLKEFKKKLKISTSSEITLKNNEVTGYKKRLLKIVENKNIEIIDNLSCPVLVPQIISRSLNNKPPFHSTKKYSDIGFRDFIIWEEVKFARNKCNDLCFISNDRNAFGDSDELHEELRKESDVYFYNLLDKFLTDYAEKIEFINEQYLSLMIEEIGLNDINNLVYPEELFFAVNIDRNIQLENIVDHEYNDVFIWNYYIYKADEKYYYVYVNCSIAISITCSGDSINLDKSVDEILPSVVKNISIKINKSTKKVDGFSVSRLI
ncbi:MAG: PIN domain-containing protein [Patescibacteria group bacterium]